jgi:membrane associated rhomboid family serine protease
MKKFPLTEFLDVVKIPILFVVLIWVLFLSDIIFQLNLHSLGVSPRKLEGAMGIMIAPLIHADLAHISNNTLPMLVLGSLLFYFYKPIAWPVFLWIYFISGIWLWIGGRNNDVIPYYHFGASTLIYGFSTFLFFSGVFRKHKQLMVVSALVVFLYGGITYGVFPFDPTISWEGHLFGAISGILVSYNYRKEGPQAPEYQWPDEEVDLEAIYNQQLEEEKEREEADKKNSNSSPNIHISYTFVKRKKDNNE